jgi:DNA-binding transcriptional LysR family regulator
MEDNRYVLIRHLQYFVTLAEERHFARAAAAANVAQPTLSAAIRKLEEDLGVPLVERTHRFVGLTVEGDRLLGWARQVLADYQSLQDDLSGLRQGLIGTLRLGVIPAAMPAVSFVTGAFCAANPLATVDIRSLTSRAIAEGLDAFQLDAGLTYLENEPIAHVIRIPLYRERYKLALPGGHPLAGRATATWEEAAGERLCLLSQDMQNRRIIDRVAASVGVDLRPAIVSNSFLAVTAHVRRGNCASIMPHSFLHLLGISAGLVAIDLVEPNHSEAVGLIVSDREPRSPMVSALLGAVASIDVEEGLSAV